MISGENMEPTEIETLLPWYAAGTLRRRDRQRVEDALRYDPALARHADLVREELAETISFNESLGVPSARCMDRLMAAIDAETGTVTWPGGADLAPDTLYHRISTGLWPEQSAAA